MNDFRIKFEVACERYLSYQGAHDDLTRGCVLRAEKDIEKPYLGSRNYIYLQFGNLKELEAFVEEAKQLIQKWAEL